MYQTRVLKILCTKYSSIIVSLKHRSIFPKISGRKTSLVLVRNASSATSRNGFNDYEKERKEFDYIIPEKFNFAANVLDVWAQKENTCERSTDIPAFWYVYEDGRQLKWSYGELAEKSKRTANILEKQCGLKKGDNLLVLLPKLPEYWLVNIAAIRTGVILSPGSMQLRAKDLEYRFKALKPKCIIAEESIADTVDTVVDSCPMIETKVLVSPTNKQRSGWMNFHELYEKSSPDHQCIKTSSNDSMMIFFTSGTTGMPKMVEQTQASYGIGLSYTGRYLLDLTENNILWNLSDTGWAKSAYSSIFSPWSLGACAFVHQMSRFQPSMFIETKELIQSWIKATGLKLYEGYGQTETVMCCGMYKCLDYKPGSMGKPPPGMNLAILDENDHELGPNEKGEVAIKRKPISPVGLLKGYKDDPERTASRLSDSYYKTGDIAYYDEDGYFWFVGRNDDIINSAGYRIGPSEVENALAGHPSVVEAAVVSSRDEIRGEVVKAFIVLTKEYLNCDKAKLIQDLQGHVKAVTAPYKYPRKIEFVETLPRTVSGKVKRFELKNKEWQ